MGWPEIGISGVPIKDVLKELFLGYLTLCQGNFFSQYENEFNISVQFVVVFFSVIKKANKHLWLTFSIFRSRNFLKFR